MLVTNEDEGRSYASWRANGLGDALEQHRSFSAG